MIAIRAPKDLVRWEGLAFESREEGFADRVIVAIAFSAHARHQVVGFELVGELFTGVLAATIGVK